MKYPEKLSFALVAMILVPTLFMATDATAQMLHDLHERADVPCSACHQDGALDVMPSPSLCVDCHGTMLKLEPGDEPVFPDPHRSPHLGPDEVPDCMSCHKIHSPSVETCTVCHRGFEFEMK